MKGKKVIKKSISLDPLLFQVMERVARDKGKSFSTMVNDAIALFINADKKVRMRNAYAEYFATPHPKRDIAAKGFLRLAKRSLPEKNVTPSR